MQRYFINKLEEEILIDDFEYVKHISKVMRMKNGDQIILVSKENQSSGLYQIKEITSSNVLVKLIEVLNEKTELKYEIDIAIGLLKKDKFEYLIQKLTELGVNKIIPLNMQRCIVKYDNKEDKKIERYKKIASLAAEQSYRLKIPDISNIINVEEINFLDYDQVLVAYEEEAKNLGISVEEIEKNKKTLVIIGPEGGIDNKEIDFLIKNNSKCIRLGNRIMRAETAPLYAMVALGVEE